MPSFGNRSLSNLQTCHPDVQVIMSEVIRYFDCSILEGFRSNEDQQKYFDQGLSKLGPGKSKHNHHPSKAWHAMPYYDKTSPSIDWEDYKGMHLLAGVIMGVAMILQKQGLISHLVRWGGDWDRDFNVREKTTFFDGAHFELYKLT